MYVLEAEFSHVTGTLELGYSDVADGSFRLPFFLVYYPEFKTFFLHGWKMAASPPGITLIFLTKKKKQDIENKLMVTKGESGRGIN